MIPGVITIGALVQPHQISELPSGLGLLGWLVLLAYFRPSMYLASFWRNLDLLRPQYGFAAEPVLNAEVDVLGVGSCVQPPGLARVLWVRCINCRGVFGGTV